MNLEDVTAENFFKKCTYSSDPDPENKIVMSNGMFINNAILLRLINEIQLLRTAIK